MLRPRPHSCKHNVMNGRRGRREMPSFSLYLTEPQEVTFVTNACENVKFDAI